MNISFRVANENDLSDAMSMMADFNALFGYDFDAEIGGTLFLHFTRDESLGRFCLVLDDSKCIGYFVIAFGWSFEYRGRDAFIDEFYLRPRYRGQGIGQQCLIHMKSICESCGVQALHLEVERHNTAARKLYEASGFTSSGRSLLTWQAQP